MTQSLSVSQALALAKGSLEQINVTIIGEISELSDKPGYKAVYFTLSDSDAALSCLMWRNVQRQLDVELRRGMLVEASGAFTVYAAKGRMNFDVKKLRLAGEGELRLKVARLAKKLEAQGLMDPARKRPLPPYPTSIALITSPRGKAIHDVIRTLRRRYPLAEVLVVGVPVEGATAPKQLIEGLRVAQDSSAEVILLVRGGGSYEDLMPFNDEELAQAIAASALPVVTGIGHEPDNSIADMVADLRASTPTAAAERVVPDKSELAASLARMEASFTRSLTAMFETHALRLDGAAQRLQQAFPLKFERDRQRIASLASRLATLGSKSLAPFTAFVELNAARLHDLSPLSALARGYSISYDQDGHVVSSVDAVKSDQQLSVRLVDGSLACTIKEKRHEKTLDISQATYPEENHV
ncbi:MAG: exodeoxyribonuclease VII large subunit [Coriobacteriales bacterium]|nr:exodeoxyribonuclease VII large subunit [Coriobacteriales bacterium]